MKKPKTVTLAPVRPNAGLEVEYRRRLTKLVAEMNKSVTYWLEASYRQNTPIMAMDATPEIFAAVDLFEDPSVRPPNGSKRFVSSSGEVISWNDLVADVEAMLAMDDMPANILTLAIRRLAKRWLKAFDGAAEDMAKFFAKAAHKRSDAQMKRILKKGGFTVEFKMTPAMRDVLNATIGENVALIKSIPQQYLKNVEVQVMQSVKAGRDLGPLAKSLEKNFGVTKRRAQLIARDQNNKATSAMNRARQEELGITTALWVHSGGGKHPRPTHKANSGKPYEVSKGWYDPDVKQWIHPGELINCRCVSRAVIKGFT